MPKKVLTCRQEIEDFVRGCTFLGTGGGGSPINGVESLMSELEKGNEVGWIDIKDLSNEETTCCPFLMGSIAPHTEEIKKEIEWFGLNNRLYSDKGILAEAVKELAKVTGKEINALVPIELGGGNTPGCIAAGISIGIPTVDGDYTGRAIPEIQQTTPYLNDKELMPYTSVDVFGNSSMVTSAVNYRFAERMGKMISAASYGLTGDAGFIMSGKETKDIIIEGTLTKCYNIGKLIRETREAGNDPVQAAADYVGGWVIAKGTVTEKQWEDRVGYLWGTHVIAGTDNNEYKIWFKNENHITWKNGEVFITSPDSVNVVNAKTGEPITNSVMKEGDEVAIIAITAVEEFTTPKGIDILGPKAFGFDYDYDPIKNRF
jgi:hypothetical protein